MKYDTENFSKICRENSSSLKSDKNTKNTLHEDMCTFMSNFFFRMRNISDKCCRENHNTHFIFSFFAENRADYVTIWKNMVVSDRPQISI